MPLNKILLILAGLLGLIMTLYVLYYLFIGLHFLKKKKTYPETDQVNKFAILIAARNEENVIAELVNSLKEQDYPKDKYDIYVLPNNCKDDTKGAAERAGAKIYEPPLPVKSKGEVLHQSFAHLLKTEDHDAYLVFDADNLVDKNFIKEMNKVVAMGYPAATGFRDSKNPTATYLSSAYSIFYLITNVMYNQARSALGMNALISGTGFMTTRKNLEKMNGWNTVSITEDVEFTLQNSLLGNKIAYVPDAIIYDEQPEDNISAWHQRERWSIGSQQGYKLKAHKLFSAALKGQGQNTFDMWLMTLATYMQIFGLIAGAVALIATFFHSFKAFIINVIFATLGLMIIQSIIAIIILLYCKKPLKGMWKGILTFWWFTLSWMPLHIMALFKDNIEWKEIEHKSVEESV